MTTVTQNTELKFERATCGRCGGSGHYSYCQMHGTTCFGCAGSGKKLTKRGAAAYAWLVAQRTIRADEVKVGDRIKSCGYTITVRAIEQSGSYSSHKDESGNEVRNYYTNLVGQKTRLGVFAETKVERIPATPEAKIEALKAAIAYQNSLTKAGKPRAAK